MTEVLESANQAASLNGAVSTTLKDVEIHATKEVGPFAIEVKNLVKQYAKASSQALAGISFRVRAGEMFGLLGPNGAGKTTTIGILTTMIRPTSGQAFVADYDVSRDPASVKKNIAVVTQQPNLDSGLNARENLLFHAAYFGVPRAIREPRADELLELLGLSNWNKRKLVQFSGGMIQRVMIARALMTNPLILFLDEPTAGLDPQSRLFLWDAIAEANKRGTTIILTTHNMEEADRLCHRVGIIDHGKLLALDTPGALKNMVPGGSRLEVRIASCNQTSLEKFLQHLRVIPHVEQAEILDSSQATGSAEAAEKSEAAAEQATVRLYASSEDLSEAIIYAAQQASVRVRELRVSKPSLENLFIFLTGKELRA